MDSRRDGPAACPSLKIDNETADKGHIDMKYIDIHPHIIADDTKRYPLAPLGGHQSDWSRTRPVTAEQMIGAMDKAGVAKAAIVQASTCYGHDNSYVADAIAAHPDRFTGVFSADVLAADVPGRCATGSVAASRE